MVGQLDGSSVCRVQGGVPVSPCQDGVSRVLLGDQLDMGIDVGLQGGGGGGHVGPKDVSGVVALRGQ